MTLTVRRREGCSYTIGTEKSAFSTHDLMRMLLSSLLYNFDAKWISARATAREAHVDQGLRPLRGEGKPPRCKRHLEMDSKERRQ